ncbi:MAG: nucleotide exchange factor GrpE [Candidatus Pacebacteria bacterium]|nr:nucleotide exchange factor GrpE [Candidatus Paceibacterota bacterium]
MEENNQINNEGELNEKIAKLEKEKEDYLNGWKRAKADYINYQKDEMKRFTEAIKYGNLELIKELLPVLDSFELSYATMNAADEKTKKGFEIIHSQLEKVLSQNGLEKIKSIGEKFNPEIHESIGEVESDKEPETIVEEIVKGWKLHEKIIRPAKVKVAKQK